MTQTHGAEQAQVQDHLIDPFEYRHMSAEFDEKRPLFESTYIGDQLSEHPEQEVFLSNKQQGGKVLTKEEYLLNELPVCAEITQNIDILPAPAKEYFEGSEAFTAIFSDLDNIDDEEFLRRTEKFIIEHGEYCRERLAALHERLDEYREKFAEAVGSAVEAGFLPRSAKDNLAMLENVSFSVHDMVLTEEEPDNLIFGYYDAQAQSIGVSIFLDDELLEKTVFHEMVHAISGHTIKTKYGGYITQVERTGMPRQHEEWSAWLNEAITEHVARSLMYGSFDVVDPIERLDKGIDQEEGPYPQERYLMGGMIRALEGHLNLPDLFDVYFQHRTEGNTDYTKALRQLVGAHNPYSFSKLIRVANQTLNRWNAGEDLDDILAPDTEEDKES